MRKSTVFKSEEDQNLKEMVSTLEKRIQKDRSAISKLPEGSLMLANDRGIIRPIWVKYENGKRVRSQIGLKDALVYDLAHKRYLEEELKLLEPNVDALKQLEKKYRSVDRYDILERMPKHFDLLNQEWIAFPELARKGFSFPNPCFSGEEEMREAPKSLEDYWLNITPAEWAELPYNANSIDGRKHFSRRGVKTRSKSEAMILDLYDELGIYYHYDENIDFFGRCMSPDVIALRGYDRKLIYHEHLGLHSEEYRQYYQYKTNLYHQAGIYSGGNLLLTFDDEDGGINMKLMEQILIDKFFK